MTSSTKQGSTKTRISLIFKADPIFWDHLTVMKEQREENIISFQNHKLSKACIRYFMHSEFMYFGINKFLL